MATANPNLSDYLSPGAQWTDADPNYTTLMGTVGHAATTAQGDVATAFHNTATRSPIVVAFVLKGDEDHIQIGCVPSAHPVGAKDGWARTTRENIGFNSV